MMRMNMKQFENALKSPEQDVLVEFLAPWCVYCRRIAPVMDRIEQEYNRKVIIVQVDIDEEPALAERERIEMVPTLVFYRDGRAVGSVVAPESKAQIVSFIEEIIGK